MFLLPSAQPFYNPLTLIIKVMPRLHGQIVQNDTIYEILWRKSKFFQSKIFFLIQYFPSWKVLWFWRSISLYKLLLYNYIWKKSIQGFYWRTKKNKIRPVKTGHHFKIFKGCLSPPRNCRPKCRRISTHDGISLSLLSLTPWFQSSEFPIFLANVFLFE